jgi:hypothetical protein
MVDPEKTTIFDKNDIIKYYGDLYMPNGKYFKKMYFINMICEMGLLGDEAIYMTDDDVLIYNDSFNEMLSEDKIIYDKEPFPLVHRCYKNWLPLYDWYKANMNEPTLHARATNFFIPQQYMKEFTDAFQKYFFSFIRLLKTQSDHIDERNTKSRSKRGCDFSVFYVEVPFFDIVFSSMNHDYFKFLPFFCVAYSELGKIKNKLKFKILIIL